jgi:hypothetical protein
MKLKFGSSKKTGAIILALDETDTTRTGCCRQGGGMKRRFQGKMTEEVRRELHLAAL